MTVPTIPIERYRAWRAHRAKLGRANESADFDETMAAAGWLLSPGSSSPYLSLRVRSDSCTRDAVDAAVHTDRTLVGVTGVRGMRFLVPKDEVVLAIAAKGRRIDARIRQVNKVVPISRGEVETLGMAIDELLAEGPATEKDLEEGLPAGMLRNFGTEGRRAGVTGVLPVALEYMAEEGKALHIDRGNRLDKVDRTYYAGRQIVPELADPVPDQLEVLPQVLERYLRSFGPARFESFVWWAGTTLNRTKTAAEQLECPPLPFQVEGIEGEFRAMEDDLVSMMEYELPDEPSVALLPNRDPYYLGQKVLGREFIDDPENPERLLARFRGKAAPARVLPALCVNGSLVGIWEWQPDAKKIDWALLPAEALHPDRQSVEAKYVDQAAARLSEAIAAELDGELVMDPIDHGPHWAYSIEELRTFW